MLRRLRRLPARFGALWRSDAPGIRAGFGALLISSGGDLLAGLALAGLSNTLTTLPGLIILIPAAIGMRGNVMGGLGSRLGTMIHAGTFRSSRRLNSDVGQNLSASIVLSLSTSVALAFLGSHGHDCHRRPVDVARRLHGDLGDRRHPLVVRRDVPHRRQSRRCAPAGAGTSTTLPHRS